MSRRDGPKVTVSLSCFDCRHEYSASYRCQGDSGCHVYCRHPDVDHQDQGQRSIGDSTWDTPEWCPLRGAALAEAGVKP